ncbi:amino acid permease-domain-containing protein [Gautieria morchelliformis]|nr:amino acid permease-domain-containing protein [Gautieria morchelliformis]
MSRATRRAAGEAERGQHMVADASIAERGLPGTETSANSTQLPSGDDDIKTTTRTQQVKHSNAYSDPGDNYWDSTRQGSLAYLELSEDDIATAMHRISEKPPTVGQLRGTSLPGNSMTSSVFYAFPAVTAAASIFSPISLLIACLILFLWRPIFLELGSAIRLNGGNYAYLLQVSGTTLGLIGAAATLLDSVATSTESAATAASYLRGEFTSSLTVSEASITIALLTVLAILCLVNVRKSSTLTLSFFFIHLLTMAILMVASVIVWSRHGSDTLRSNWDLRPRGTSNTARAIFNGICVGFLGVTGFETTPTYIEAIHPDAYGPVLRNILFCTLFLNAPLMLMVYAVLPEQTINSGTNILSILAETVAGRWLRILVVVDAILVLAGGVIDGICSGCALLDRLAKDQVFSEALLKTLPVTGSQYLLIMFCFALNILLYAASGFSLTTISAVFTVTFLSTLLMFVLSDILLKFNRDRLPRSHKPSLLAVFFTLAVVIVLLVGNIFPNPKILALFAIYFLATLLPLLATQAEDPAARVLLWLYYQCRLHKLRWTEGWDMKIIDIVKRARRHPVCVWVGRGDTMNLMNFILYIRNNEITSHVTFVHAYRDIESIPSELAPNIKLLDEASTFTIDLMFVRGNFEPALVEAVSAKTGIPRSKMFMSCPSESHGWEIGDYQGVRVVTKC